MNASELCIVGKPRTFTGFVDDFEFNITAIEFSLDNGEHWTSYAVQDASPEVGISWSFCYIPTQTGWHFLKIRARDGANRPSKLIATIPFLAIEAPSSETNALFTKHAQMHTPENDSHIHPISNGTAQQALLFRSGTLAQATANDALLINQFGIHTIYDMRTPREIAQSPDTLFAGVCSIALTPSEQGRRKDVTKRLIAGVIGEYGAPEERMIRNYRKYASDYPLIGKALRSIADQGTPALVHCENGKDRTGVLCAVAQRIAGISHDIIMADYLAYNKNEASCITEEASRLNAGMTAEEHDMLLSFLEARPSYLEAFFDEIDLQFGSFESYIEQGLRLTESQRQRLSALVLGQ